MFKVLTVPKAARCFQITLALFLFLMPWQTIWIYSEKVLNGAKWQYGTLGYYGTEVLLWLSVFFFITWFWRSASDRIMGADFHITRDRLFVASILVFIVYIFSSSFWAPVGDVARQQALRLFSGFLLFFMVYIGPLSWQRALHWFFAGAVVQALFGVWQFVTQTSFSSTLFGLTSYSALTGGTAVVEGIGRWVRAYGAFSHPNVFGGYMLVSLLLLVYLVKNIKLTERGKTILSVCFAICVSGLFFSFSRSAWIGGFILLCSMFYFGMKNKCGRLKAWSLIGMGILLLCSLCFFSLVQSRIVGNSYVEVISAEDRVSNLQEAISVYAHNLILGTGIGNYTIGAYMLDPTRHGYAYQPVHNVPALIFSELGLIGVLLFMHVMYRFTQFYKETKPTQKQRSHFLWWGIVFAPILLFDHYMWTSFVGICLFFFSLAIVLRIGRT